jgi:hypothetical protein
MRNRKENKQCFEFSNANNHSHFILTILCCVILNGRNDIKTNITDTLVLAVSFGVNVSFKLGTQYIVDEGVASDTYLIASELLSNLH